MFTSPPPNITKVHILFTFFVNSLIYPVSKQIVIVIFNILITILLLFYFVFAGIILCIHGIGDPTASQHVDCHDGEHIQYYSKH